jgi:hypothetical protein
MQSIQAAQKQTTMLPMSSVFRNRSNDVDVQLGLADMHDDAAAPLDAHPDWDEQCDECRSAAGLSPMETEDMRVISSFLADEPVPVSMPDETAGEVCVTPAFSEDNPGPSPSIFDMVANEGNQTGGPACPAQAPVPDQCLEAALSEPGFILLTQRLKAWVREVHVEHPEHLRRQQEADQVIECARHGLASLHLNSQGISSVERLPLRGLSPHLTLLSIQGGSIPALPEELHLLTELRFLDVSHNGLTRIPATVSRLRHLEILLASSNQLKEFPEDLLASLPFLTTVELENNPLREIPGLPGPRQADRLASDGITRSAVLSEPARKRRHLVQLLNSLAPYRKSFARSRSAWNRTMGYYLESLIRKVKHDTITPITLELMAGEIKLMVDGMKNDRWWTDMRIASLERTVLDAKSREQMGLDPFLKGKHGLAYSGVKHRHLNPVVCDRMSASMDIVLAFAARWKCLAP